LAQLPAQFVIAYCVFERINDLRPDVLGLDSQFTTSPIPIGSAQDLLFEKHYRMQKPVGFDMITKRNEFGLW
jgi:hypothetical protein